MPGRTPLHLPALSATVLRPAFLPPNQECSTDSSGLPDPLPPSDDLDWGQLCFACDFLLRSSIPPAHPVFPSTFPGLPRVLLSHLAAPDLALSSASRLVHSAAKTCYASSRSISFSCDCTLSALITASLTPSVIGDRPSHPICFLQRSGKIPASLPNPLEHSGQIYEENTRIRFRRYQICLATNRKIAGIRA